MRKQNNSAASVPVIPARYSPLLAVQEKRPEKGRLKKENRKNMNSNREDDRHVR